MGNLIDNKGVNKAIRDAGKLLTEVYDKSGKYPVKAVLEDPNGRKFQLKFEKVDPLI